MTDGELTPEQRRRLDALRSVRSLAELAELTGATTADEAYFDAKRDWYVLRGKELPPPEDDGGLPGSTVEVDGTEFLVHGVTHAGTDAERGFLRRHVKDFLDAGDAVYCEQGIRPMYFADFDAVREIDDYRWSMEICEDEGFDTHIDNSGMDDISENFEALAATFRGAVFSLLNSGKRVYGERFADAVGDVATDFLTSPEDIAKGDDFESYRMSHEAAEDPARLGELQRYYKRRFLPQPVEREWLRRYDPEIEVFTHARNERIADYAVYDADALRVRIIVGAAHQPGVVYYLRQHRDGSRDTSEFEFTG